MFNLDGKKVLITGATGGIGAGICKALLSHGANLAISGTSVSKLENFASSLSREVDIMAVDLSDTKTASKLVEDANSVLGGLDILICNAGITRDKLAIRTTDEDCEEVMRINFMSLFAMNRSAIKIMSKQNNGSIINMSSVVGVSGNPGQSIYCASKAAIIGMSKSLAAEYASRGIRVNSIAPGFIESPMTDKLNEAQKNSILSNIPAGRMGTPDDIAAAVIYLASDESSYVTGHTLHVNGGMLMV